MVQINVVKDRDLRRMEHVLSVSLIREDKETESNVHQTNAVLLKSFYLMEPVIVVHNFKGHKEMET